MPSRIAAHRPLLLASLVYLTCDLAIWRPGISFGLTAGAVGSSRSSDYQVMTWALEWWPWAIEHGVDPLHTSLVWAPAGYPTTWMTSIPVLSLLAAPVTLLTSPLVSYNLLMLAAPLAAALACYRLCLDLCARTWPSVLGGFLFGFSPYLLGQAISQHLNLVMVWPLPLLVLVCLRYCRSQISGRRALAASAGLGLFLLGTSLEIFATTAAVGGIVAMLALVFEREHRRRIASLVGVLAAAVAIVLLLAAPVIWLTLGQRRPPLPYAPEQYATDVANLLVPTLLTVGGTTSVARGISGRFVGNVGEADGYLGLPLVAVCLVAAWRDWRRRAWIAASALVVAFSLSLGPALVIAGHTVGDIPFALDRLPVFALALPSRLAVFVLLAAICLAVRWLAYPDLQRVRIALGVLIAISFAPYLGAITSVRAEANAHHAHLPVFAWDMPRAANGFLSFADHVAPGTTVLALPLGGLSPAQFWQAETTMRFRLAGGYTPFAPAATATDPLVAGFVRNAAPPLAVYRLRAYLARARVQLVLVQASAVTWLRIVRAATRATPNVVAGTDVFRVDGPLLRELLARPRRPGPKVRGVALSPRGTPLASLAASGDGTVSTVAWLTFDWQTRHVVVQATSRRGRWSRVTTLSSPWLEASDLRLAVGGARSVVSWIESGPGTATLRVAELRRDRWVRVALPSTTAVAVGNAVAVAPDGVATIAWTVQDGARTDLRALRIGASGRVSAAADLSNPNHSVDAFGVAAAAGQSVVAWRERDATSIRLFAATLAGAHGWEGDRRLAAGASPGVPVASVGRNGAIVMWTTHASGTMGLDAQRFDARGAPTRTFVLARPRHQLIPSPSVSPARGGVLVAWCARIHARSALHVVLVGRSSITPMRGAPGGCPDSPPHLVPDGRLHVLNAAGDPPRLYLVSPGLRCTRLPRVRIGGAYRLIVRASTVEAVTGAGFAGSTVSVRRLASLRDALRPCAAGRRAPTGPALDLPG